MNYLFFFILGGILALIINKFIKDHRQISRLEVENKRLRDILQTEVNRNTNDIFLLKEMIKPMPDQMVQFLEWLSDITNIRNDRDFIATYVATLEFKKKYGLKDKDDTQIYQSD